MASLPTEQPSQVLIMSLSRLHMCWLLALGSKRFNYPWSLSSIHTPWSTTNRSGQLDSAFLHLNVGNASQRCSRYPQDTQSCLRRRRGKIRDTGACRCLWISREFIFGMHLLYGKLVLQCYPAESLYSIRLLMLTCALTRTRTHMHTHTCSLLPPAYLLTRMGS